ARHVAKYVSHWIHAVEADLMIERSETVDRLLDLKKFTVPYTRTVRGIAHGDQPGKVHEALGPPDATRYTHGNILMWDYYFEEDVIFEYHSSSVSKLTLGVPESIRNREKEPLIRYRDTEALP